MMLSGSGIVATVFGATGFLGRYLVQQLGREYETRNYSFEEVNHHMAEQLAIGLGTALMVLSARIKRLRTMKPNIAKEHGGIMRYIHVSCLGASPSSPSRMLRTKAAAEEAISRELPEATVMRPAVMLGTEDRILNPWAHFAKKYSFLPLIGDGSTKFQPVYVVDVASAIIAALKDDGTSMGKVYELGGPEIYTMHELAIATPRELLLKKVPFPMPVPTIFNLDQIEALSTDTLVSENGASHRSMNITVFYNFSSLYIFLSLTDNVITALTFEDLGIAPRKIKGYPIEFLIQYRKGGPNYGSTVSEKVTPNQWS
ncbi:hypothetical protein DH2020_001271 [Rehmannia glutinosa]|uniref:NAD-dependent epimerase/dehydratase domain-containing protein n=1 Tax=Rehmannia glutinosa TaxID=99300 RepID=A0ABR0XYV3_REHGL